jgi:hypothetical protein
MTPIHKTILKATSYTMLVSLALLGLFSLQVFSIMHHTEIIGVSQHVILGPLILYSVLHTQATTHSTIHTSLSLNLGLVWYFLIWLCIGFLIGCVRALNAHIPEPQHIHHIEKSEQHDTDKQRED